MARRKPTKTLRPKPAERKLRIHTTPKLTRHEFEKLQARAAAEMRSVANYVAFLIVQHLRSGRRKLPPLLASRSGDVLIAYDIAVPLPGSRGPSSTPRRRSRWGRCRVMWRW